MKKISKYDISTSSLDLFNKDFLEVLTKEYKAIKRLKKSIETDPEIVGNIHKVFEAFRLAYTNNNRVFFSGIGKNEPIAKKIASTFASLSLPAFYFDSVSAIHGDLGMVADNDIIIYLSRSGKTEEIIRTMRYIYDMNKKGEDFKNIIQIGLDCNNEDSNFSAFCNISIHLYLREEADYLDLAPSASSTLLLAFGDALGITFAKMVGIDKEIFHLNHPGGSLGKMLEKGY